MRITAIREHEIACGHRVVGHEGKCQYLHGHNYLFRFVCEAGQLDEIGRVIDFGVIKERLCMWLERNWDHKFLAWNQDPLMAAIVHRVLPEDTLTGQLFKGDEEEVLEQLVASLVWLHFNPTAENMARYMVEVVGPRELAGTGVRLVACTVGETRKCSAEAVVTCGDMVEK